MKECFKSPDVAILCQGESFNDFLDSPRDHDTFIGVNKTVEAWECDWWTFADYQAFQWYRPKGNPQCFTSPAVFHELVDRSRDKLRLFEWEIGYVGRETCPQASQWFTLSLGWALILAAKLEPTTISIYGADMQGKRDWDGTLPKIDRRDDERWSREKRMYRRVERWLKRNGIEVVRHVSDRGALV